MLQLNKSLSFKIAKQWINTLYNMIIWDKPNLSFIKFKEPTSRLVW